MQRTAHAAILLRKKNGFYILAHMFLAIFHRERSGLTTTCGCLFGFVTRKKKAHVPGEIYQRLREESSQRAPPFFVGGGSIN